eukprot:1154042-Pelagomonas_calceolata.AAC.1
MASMACLAQLPALELSMQAEKTSFSLAVQLLPHFASKEKGHHFKGPSSWVLFGTPCAVIYLRNPELKSYRLIYRSDAGSFAIN